MFKMSKKISDCVNLRLEEIIRLYHSCDPCYKISNSLNASTIWLISGVEIFGKGLGDLYYASNQLDPYLKDKDVSTTTFFCHDLASITYLASDVTKTSL